MKKITKEMCVVFVKDYYKSKVVSFALLSVFLTIGLWIFTRKLLVVGFGFAVMLILMIFLGFNIRNKIENINFGEFYVVEDVVFDFKKRFRLERNSGGRFDYIYEFKNYGKYTITKSLYPTVEIPLHRERHIKHLAVDKLSSKSVNKGDIFYLLVFKARKLKIIKCFYRRYFDIAKEDFDYIDGKYYCK